MKKKNWFKVHEESTKWARWIALYEAINYCADKAEEKKIPFEKVNLKPLEIMRYITSTEDIILKKLLKEEYNIDVYYDEKEDSMKEEFSY